MNGAWWQVHLISAAEIARKLGGNMKNNRLSLKFLLLQRRLLVLVAGDCVAVALGGGQGLVAGGWLDDGRGIVEDGGSGVAGGGGEHGGGEDGQDDAQPLMGLQALPHEEARI